MAEGSLIQSGTLRLKKKTRFVSTFVKKLVNNLQVRLQILVSLALWPSPDWSGHTPEGPPLLPAEVTPRLCAKVPKPEAEVDHGVADAAPHVKRGVGGIGQEEEEEEGMFPGWRHVARRAVVPTSDKMNYVESEGVDRSSQLAMDVIRSCNLNKEREIMWRRMRQKRGGEHGK